MTSCMNIEGIHTHIDDLYALHTYCTSKLNLNIKILKHKIGLGRGEDITSISKTIKSNYLFHEKTYLAEQGPEIWNHTF